MAGVEISPLLEFGLELGALTLSPIITAAIIAARQKAAKKLAQPKESVEEIKNLRVVLDKFIETYNVSMLRNKKFQEALFRSTELSFCALESQTKSIRHLAESVCNGNKKEALAACSEADDFCEKGRAIKNEALMERSFGGDYE